MELSLGMDYSKYKGVRPFIANELLVLYMVGPNFTGHRSSGNVMLGFINGRVKYVFRKKNN